MANNSRDDPFVRATTGILKGFYCPHCFYEYFWVRSDRTLRYWGCSAWVRISELLYMEQEGDRP